MSCRPGRAWRTGVANFQRAVWVVGMSDEAAAYLAILMCPALASRLTSSLHPSRKCRVAGDDVNTVDLSRDDVCAGVRGAAL